MTFIQTIKQTFTKTTPHAGTPSAESSQFITSKEEFLFIQKAFKEKARTKQITSTDILLYNIIRGKNVDRGFTPITNPKKLEGGEKAYNGMRKLFECKQNLRWTIASFSTGSTPGPFAVTYGLTRETCVKILNVLKGE